MADLRFQNALNSILGNMANVRLDMHKYVKNLDFDSARQIEEIAFLANDILDRKIYKIEIEPVAKYNEPVCEVPDPYIHVIDQIENVPEMVDTIVKETLLSKTGDESPVIYMDCEGDNLGRTGTLTHINMYLPKQNEAFILDIDVLGDKALKTVGTKHRSRNISSVLQDSHINKGIFDVRSDSDALYEHHGISLDGIVDLQLMENATCKSKKTAQRLSSLTACIGRLNMQKSARERVLQIKEQGKAAMKSGNPFHDRPLSKLMIDYSIGDLILMPALYRYFTTRPGWSEQWKAREQHATAQRLELSRAPEFRDLIKAGSISMTDPPEEWKLIDRFEDVEKASRAALNS